MVSLQSKQYDRRIKKCLGAARIMWNECKTFKAIIRQFCRRIFFSTAPLSNVGYHSLLWNNYEAHRDMEFLLAQFEFTWIFLKFVGRKSQIDQQSLLKKKKKNSTVEIGSHGFSDIHLKLMLSVSFLRQTVSSNSLRTPQKANK